MGYNDYSLLRPFDLEAAKRGEPICLRNGTEAKFLVHFPEVNNKESRVAAVVAVDDECDDECNVGLYYESGTVFYNSGHPYDLCMAPLCWLEDKPVYAGDKLWHKPSKKFRIYHHMNAEGYLCQKGEGTGDSLLNLTWEIPKKIIKMLAYIDAGGWLIWRKEGIEITPSHGVVRVPSEDKIVEVE